MIPEEAKLVCDVCRDNKYYAAALLMFAERVVNPNTFWWLHFPKDTNDMPLRCNAGEIFELHLKSLVKNR